MYVPATAATNTPHSSFLWSPTVREDGLGRGRQEFQNVFCVTSVVAQSLPLLSHLLQLVNTADKKE